MRYILGLGLTLLASAVAAQDFTPEFYAGATGSLAPSLGTQMRYGEGDNAIFSAGAFAGVSMLSGPMLYGLEASIASDFGKTSAGEYYQPNTAPPLPRLSHSSTCYGCPLPPGGTIQSEVPGGQASNESLTYGYIETLARPALTARVGIRSGDWTIYGKAGLGLAYERRTQVNDRTGTVNCRATAVETRFQSVPGGGVLQETWFTDCLDPQAGTRQSTTTDSWTPVGVYGIGAEYDFNQFFARGEIEATHVINGGASIRANGGLGIRF